MHTSNPSYPITPSTFGETYDQEIDGQRIATQLEVIAEFMEYCRDTGKWVSLAEIEEATGYPQSSISAQLRHLRKKQFGSHVVEKRRRHGAGTYEYMVVS